eukprot:scaffold14521_cov73-Phaeocystis_antarctica.AAC.3
MEEYAQSRLCVVAPIEFCHHGQRLMWLVGRSMLQGRGPMSRLRERGGSRTTARPSTPRGALADDKVILQQVGLGGLQPTW